MPLRVLPALPRVTSTGLALLLSATVVAGEGQPGEAGGGPASGPPAVTVAEPLHLVSAGSRRRVHRALRVARAQIGDRYRYGAEGPRRFDCSGLVYFSTHAAGFSRVPRTSSEQAEFMRRIKRSAMRRGDFVFFTGRSGVYHVGIFAGRSDGKRHIVHAPSTGARVSRAPIWTNSWFPGTLRR